MPDLWLPQHLRPAVKRTAVVFYWNKDTDHTLVGFPEQFPCPHKGYQKIVCQNAADVDRWDAKLRAQEKRIEEMTDEQREAVEGPMRRQARAELYQKMMNSRNAMNRDFCKHAIAQIDEYEENLKKQKTEKFQHLVGYEDGK